MYKLCGNRGEFIFLEIGECASLTYGMDAPALIIHSDSLVNFIA